MEGVMAYEIGEFKGHRVITLKNKPDDKYPFTFGFHKAKLILENMDAIQTFVDMTPDNPKNDKVPPMPEPKTTPEVKDDVDIPF